MKTSNFRILLTVSSFIIMNVASLPEAYTQDTTDVVFDDPYKYPLSDPRNPNCPCHVQQRQADEEFAKLTSRGRGGSEVAPMFNTPSHLPENASHAQQIDQVSGRTGIQADSKAVWAKGLRTAIGKADYWLYKKSKRWKQKLGVNNRMGKKLKKCFPF